jgi:hypothetical protein
MARPQKVRVTRRTLNQDPIVPPLPPEPPEPDEEHNRADTVTLASEVILADVDSSPLTPQADSVSGQPVDGIPVQNPYDEFGDDFDREDDVDDYALLHPNSPRNVPMEPLQFAIEDHAIPPLQSATLGPSRQIRFMSPIVIMHSPVGTPADVPVAKRHWRKAASPHKEAPECIPASDKGKDRAPAVDGDSPTAHQSVIQYWENPVDPANLPAHGLGMGPLEPTIDAFLHDIKGYAQRFRELGPEATAGLIYHTHQKLQNSLLSGPLPGIHGAPPSNARRSFMPSPGNVPPASSFQALQPSPVIVRPGTGESPRL